MTRGTSGASGADPASRLEQLVYASVSTPRVTSALQMSDILAVARQRNSRDGVTGALTAADGRFIQIIEGPTLALDDLMTRLDADSRHRAIEVLDRRAVPGRAFAGWDMVSPRLVFDETVALGELLGRADATLDDYIAVFTRALQRQDALLGGGQEEDEAFPQAGRANDPSGGTSLDPEA